MTRHTQIARLVQELTQIELGIHDLFYEREQSKGFYRYLLLGGRKSEALQGMYAANGRLSESLKKKASYLLACDEQQFEKAMTDMENDKQAFINLDHTLRSAYLDYDAVYRYSQATGG